MHRIMGTSALSVGAIIGASTIGHFAHAQSAFERAQPNVAPTHISPRDKATDVDSDHDGLPDQSDTCPQSIYAPGYDWSLCAPMDLNPLNDSHPVCRARERVAQVLMTDEHFVTHMSFAVIKGGELYFADAFEYIGQGQFVRRPEGIHRLYRVGSTSKSVVAAAAMSMEERGELSLADFVNDNDASQEFANPQRTLRQLLTHNGAFKTDYGAIHLFCYPGDLAAFWAEPDDVVSPHYTSSQYGNLNGGYQYSAFNYSLAGAYLANRAQQSFADVLQSRVFDDCRMCTAMLDGTRAKSTTIGNSYGVSETGTMHVGPYINHYSTFDPRCEDNFYSSDDLPGDPYTWQLYNIDEAAAEARDPAGGVIASAIDLARFAEALLDSYHDRGGPLSPEGVRQLWWATTDLGCGGSCPYERYYGIGFFSDTLPGQPVNQVGHGGARPGFATGFVIRPEADAAVCVLANADVSTVKLSDLAKAILNDFAD